MAFDDTVMVSSLSGSVVSYLRAVYTKILTPSVSKPHGLAIYP